MKKILLVLFLAPAVLLGANVQISIQAPEYVGHQAQLIRFSDYFTFTPELLSAELVGEDGSITLSGDIKHTELALIRIDHVNAYLYITPGAELNVVFPPLTEGVARSIGNTNYVELSFIDLESTDPNVQLSLLNDRISEFYDKYIIMYKLEDQKAAGTQTEDTGEGLANDTPKKKFSLRSKVDSLNSVLKEEFKDIEDAIVQSEIEYSIALLYWNANVSRNWLFENYFLGKPLQMNSSAWVDLFRNFYQNHFILGPMFSHEVEFRQALEFDKDPQAAVELLKQNDLVETDDMASLLLMNGIFEYYHSGQFNKKALREVLEKMNKSSRSKQLGTIARMILADLTNLERSLPAPEFSLIDNDRNVITLEEFKGQYLYVGFWASWCSSCMKELGAMKKRFEDYGKFVQFLTINMDEDVYERADALEDLGLPWPDLYYLNDPLILDRYRIRSVPQFFLIGPDGNILEAPADRPSEGIAAQMHRIKVAAKKNEQIKIWDN